MNSAGHPEDWRMDLGGPGTALTHVPARCMPGLPTMDSRASQIAGVFQAAAMIRPPCGFANPSLGPDDRHLPHRY